MRRNFNQNYTSLPEDNFGQGDSEEMNRQEWDIPDRSAVERPVRSHRREIPSRENRVDIESFREAARYQGKNRQETPVVGHFADYGSRTMNSGFHKGWKKTGLMPLFLSWGGGMAVGSICCIVLAYFNFFPHRTVEAVFPAKDSGIAVQEKEEQSPEAAKVAMDMPTVLPAASTEWNKEVLGDIPAWNPELMGVSSGLASHPISSMEPVMSSSAEPVSAPGNSAMPMNPVMPAMPSMPVENGMPADNSMPSISANNPMNVPVNGPAQTVFQPNVQTALPQVPVEKQASDIYLGTNTPDMNRDMPQAVQPNVEKTAIRDEAEYSWNQLAADETDSAGPALNQEIPPMKNEITRFVPAAVHSSSPMETGAETNVAARPVTMPKGRFAGYQLPGQAGAGSMPVSATAMRNNTGDKIR